MILYLHQVQNYGEKMHQVKLTSMMKEKIFIIYKWIMIHRINLFSAVIIILLFCIIIILCFPGNHLLTKDELETLITEKGIELALINYI